MCADLSEGGNNTDVPPDEEDYSIGFSEENQDKATPATSSMYFQSDATNPPEWKDAAIDATTEEDEH